MFYLSPTLSRFIPAPPGLLSSSIFYLATTRFCHPSTLAYTYTPASGSLVRSTLVPPRKFRLSLALLPRRCLPPHVLLVSRPRV
jgi:hypothetical protein